MEISETILEKLKNLLEKVKEEKPGICLFVIVQVNGINRWDVVFGGRGLEGEENLKLILRLLKQTFGREEMILFSRLIMLNSNNPFVSGMNNTFNVEANYMEIINSKINNLLVKKAYLFYSKRLGSNI